MSKVSMNCRQVRRLLTPFTDQELSGRVRDEVTSHLESCPACRAELEALKADLGVLEQFPAPEVAPFLVTRVMAEVRQRRRHSAFGLSIARVATTMVSVLAVAVCVGVGVFFGSGLARASTETAANSTEAEVSYVESSTASMYNLMWGGN